MTARNQKVLVLAACAVLLALAWGLWQRPSMAFWRTHETAPALILSGNIEAHESVLSFKSVQSRITELPFHEGQSVRKGDVLALVDSADYQQQLAIAQSNLALLLPDATDMKMVETLCDFLRPQLPLLDRDVHYSVPEVKDLVRSLLSAWQHAYRLLHRMTPLLLPHAQQQQQPPQ